METGSVSSDGSENLKAGRHMVFSPRVLESPLLEISLFFFFSLNHVTWLEVSCELLSGGYFCFMWLTQTFAWV